MKRSRSSRPERNPPDDMVTYCVRSASIDPIAAEAALSEKIADLHELKRMKNSIQLSDTLGAWGFLG